MTTTAPHAIGHHLDAYTADGLPARLPSGGIADELWADFRAEYAPGGDTLAAARARAERLFATVARVAYVTIRESVQEHAWSSWKAGRGVERIDRGDRPMPRFTVEPWDVHAMGEDLWSVIGPDGRHAAGPYGGREAAERAAARLGSGA